MRISILSVPMTSLITLIIASLVNAAPVTNSPRSDPSPAIGPPFEPEPKGRGTFRIFSSCVITLVICVWTAVHPNVIRNPSTPRRFWNKTMYVVLGLFSPEIVLAVAFKEWRDAASILQEARLAGAADYVKDEICQARAFDCHVGSNEAEGGKAEVEVAEVACGENEADADGGKPVGVNGRVYVSPGLGPLIQAAETAADAARLEVVPDDSRQSENPQWIAFVAARRLRVARKAYEKLQAAGERSTFQTFWIWIASFQIWIAPFRATRIGNFVLPIEASVYEFSRECSFFAVMGGYTIRPLDRYTEPDLYNDHGEEYTIDPMGFKFLLRQQIITTDMLQDVKNEVLDKGKSDMLAKLLVCMQALWMLLNCLARKAAGLPITLLELNVAMHVICALTVYVFWWMKPHDVGRPISLSPLFVRTGMSELIYTIHKFGLDHIAPGPDEFSRGLAGTDKSQTEPSTAENGRTPPLDPEGDPAFNITPVGHTRGGPATDGDLTVENNHSLPSQPPIGGPNASIESLHEPAKPVKPERDSRDGKIYAIAAHELRKTANRRLASETDGQLTTPKFKIFAKPSRFRTGKNLVWTLLPLCLIYSGIHASAWNNHFPTPIERLLWRISCCIIAAPGLGAIAIRFMESLMFSESTLDESSKRTENKLTRFSSRLQEKTGTLFKSFKIGGIGGVIGGAVITVLAAGLSAGAIYGYMSILRLHNKKLRLNLLILFSVEILGLAGASAVASIAFFIIALMQIDWKTVGIVLSIPLTITYCAARVFIVLESFLCLRSLPVGSFDTISWDNVWPHL